MILSSRVRFRPGWCSHLIRLFAGGCRIGRPGR